MQALKEPSAADTPAEAEELVEQARQRTARPLDGRERIVEAAGATAFVVVALALALLGEADRPLHVGTAALLVAGYAVATRIRFEVGAGYTDPSQLVFVPMLFLLPMPAVPGVVALA